MTWQQTQALSLLIVDMLAIGWIMFVVIPRRVAARQGAERDAHSARADTADISLEQQAAHEALLVGDAALLDA